MTNRIDKSICSKCGRCVVGCDMGIVEMGDAGAEFIPMEVDRCVKCGHCIASCPEGAIKIDGLDSWSFPDPSDSCATYGQLQKLMDCRRSIRKFTDEGVESEKLEKILDAISTTPVSCGGNPPPVTIINGREKLDAMVEPMMKFYKDFYKGMTSTFGRIFFRLMMGKKAFVAVQEFIPIMKMLINHYDSTGEDSLMWGAPTLLLFHAPKGDVGLEFDPTICCTYAMLAAHSQGLGTAMLGVIAPYVNEKKGVKKSLGIPEGNVVKLSLIVGHPKLKFSKGIRRKVSLNWA
jgi:ferredoxin